MIGGGSLHCSDRIGRHVEKLPLVVGLRLGDPMVHKGGLHDTIER